MSHANTPSDFAPPAKTWAALLLCLLSLAVMGTAVPAECGQKELMEAWEARQQDMKDKVYERLREEGKLPEDGTVYFKARTKRDPADQDKLLITVDEVQVVPSPEGFAPVSPGKAQEPPAEGDTKMVPSGDKAGLVEPTPITSVTIEWHNMDVSDFIREETLDIPVDQEFMGRFEVRKGVVVPARESSGSEAGAPPAPEARGWTRVGPKTDESNAGVP